MKLISIIDTTISDDNLGNRIIMEAVIKHLKEIFKQDFFIYIPFIDKLGKQAKNYIKESDVIFFGGTNSLSSNMLRYKQWNINLFDTLYLKNVILMGIGWWQYQDEPDLYTKFLLKKVLSKNYIHSTRDLYTKIKLEKIGFKNIINTGCPSIWDLTPKHCNCIPTEKEKNVLLTFTSYYKNYRKDRELFDILKRNYKRIFFWPQQYKDFKYSKEIFNSDFKFVEYLNPSLEALDRFFSSQEEVEYVGTRLHCYIRALQHKRRAINIGVDNRAIEMSKDFGLVVVRRDELYRLEGKIKSEFKTMLNIPIYNIKKWKRQFSNGVF